MGDERPFIPRKMDDAGLTAAQFRILCRVSRRGECYESIANMARGCRLAIKTVKSVLPHLISRNMLSKQNRTGQTSVYRVQPAMEWRAEPGPNDYPAQMATQVVKPPPPQGKRHPAHPAQTVPHKGNPTKAIPIMGDPHGMESCDPGLLARDRERLQKQIREERDAAKPDKDLITGLVQAFKRINDEFRRRGSTAGKMQTNSSDTMLHQPSDGTRRPSDNGTLTDHTQPKRTSEHEVLTNIWKLSEEERAKFTKLTPPNP